MKSVGASEARTHLYRLLDDVRNGERFTITRRGRPVAVLMQPEGVQRVDPETMIEAFCELRKSNRLEGVTIRELIEDGRR